MDWFWFSPETFNDGTTGPVIPGIWIYIPKVDGLSAQGWCYWKVVLSTGSGGGITPWVWSARDSRWHLVNDVATDIFTQTGSVAGSEAKPSAPTITVEAPPETGAPPAHT